MAENKKYFYLKLKDTFFDSEEMKLLETMQNGEKYQNVYLKLCLLSLKNEGALLFKNLIPYNIEMLSKILRVDIDTMKTSVEIFTQIGLLTIMDSGIIYMNDIQSLIGRSSTEAERIKKYREKLSTKSVQMLQNCTPKTEIDTEIDTEIEKEQPPKPKKQTFQKPTIEEIREYCQERKNNVDPQRFFDFYESKGWLVGKSKMKDWKASVRTWEKNSFSNQSKDQYNSINNPDKLFF